VFVSFSSILENACRMVQSVRSPVLSRDQSLIGLTVQARTRKSDWSQCGCIYTVELMLLFQTRDRPFARDDLILGTGQTYSTFSCVLLRFVFPSSDVRPGP
jgi:hypothetical protein